MDSVLFKWGNIAVSAIGFSWSTVVMMLGCYKLGRWWSVDISIGDAAAVMLVTKMMMGSVWMLAVVVTKADGGHKKVVMIQKEQSLDFQHFMESDS